jgi:purine-binding chemotaxis protein CheW
MPLTAAEALRQEFDATFARAFGDAELECDDLLAVLVGRRRYALRVAELGGVAAGRRVTPVPSGDAALLGLVGVRGDVVPVYDLARLMGEAPAVEPPRWLALSAGADPVALAFDELEGHLRLPRSALESAARGHVTHVIREEAGLRPVVDVPSVARAVRTGSAEGSRKEP